ncbi:MAG: ABC transporter permease, partial [Clostridiales bacterium]|nr:ABC transporter permease [Clostridiales bacterium]
RSFITLLVILLTLFGIMSFISPHRFPTVFNLQSMAVQISDIALMALAMLVVILTGNINLSVVATSNLSGILCALIANGTLMSDFTNSLEIRILAATLAAIMSGAMCGLLNGLFIGKLKLASILVTVATMSLFDGISTVLTRGQSVMGIPKQMLEFGGANYFGIPSVLLIVVLAFVIVGVILNAMSLGEHIKLYGANPVANLYSGGKNCKIVIISYIISGVLAGISGVIVYTKVGVARVDYGSSYTNIILLIVLLSGASMAGGFGKLANLFFAAIAVQIISSGLTIGGFSAYFRQVSWGVLLLLVIVLNTEVFRSKRRLVLQRWKGGRVQM